MDPTREQFLEIVKNTPLVSIDLVIRDESGAVLTGMRTNAPACGYWFVPGGRIRKSDADLAAAFTRIVTAELGDEGVGKVKFADARLLGIYEHRYADNYAGNDQFDTYYIVLGCEVRCERLDIPKLPLLKGENDEQHSAWRYYEVDELLKAIDVHQNVKNYFTEGTAPIRLAE